MAAISLTGRQALHDYKYQSTMKGWLDLNVMDPFWERLVLWFPLSVAPNAITFVGGIQYILSTFVLSTHCPDFETSVETWLYYMLGVSLFVYQTMDAIDGKQARRTKQSSPLGQLFDHGIDALLCTFFFVNSGAIVQMGTNWIFISCLMAGYTAFFYGKLESTTLRNNAFRYHWRDRRRTFLYHDGDHYWGIWAFDMEYLCIGSKCELSRQLCCDTRLSLF
eukprot:980499_1